MQTPTVAYIPGAAQIAARLQLLSTSEIHKLSRLSGVPFPTLLKIKTAETANPGIETVRKFEPFIEAAKVAA